MHSSMVVGKEMGNERREIGLDLVDEEILENQRSKSGNSDNHNNNNDSNNNTTTTTNHDKQDHPFLPTTPTTTTTTPNNIIHHLSANGMCNDNSSSCNHEQVDQFLQIPTTTISGTTNKEQADLLPPPISTTNNNIPSHFLSSTAPRAKNSNNNNTTKEQDPFVPISNANNSNQNFYAKGCRKNNNSSSSSCSSPATNNNKEQDRFLPIANVGRIMKKFIPGNGKISKDAKETVQECVSEFISFITGEASDKCQREKRKTINGDDIIWAITTLGFEDYVTPLKQYLNKYRELEGEKLNVPKQQRNSDHHQKPNMPNYHHNVYSSPGLLSQPTFVPNDQPFPLPFPQTSNIQTRLQQHEHIDSVRNW